MKKPSVSIAKAAIIFRLSSMTCRRCAASKAAGWNRRFVPQIWKNVMMKTIADVRKNHRNHTQRLHLAPIL